MLKIERLHILSRQFISLFAFTFRFCLYRHHLQSMYLCGSLEDNYIMLLPVTVIFYMFLNHFYLITDENVIRHISHSFKETSVIRTHLQSDNLHKTDKVIQLYSNMTVKEALALPENSVVIYEKYNLNDEFKEYIKITNDAKPVLKYGSKTSIHKIVSKNKVTLTISGCLGEGIDWKSIKLICEKIIWSFIINLLEVY